MAEIYSNHLKQRLLDFALKKTVRPKNRKNSIPLCDVSPTEDAESCTFEVSTGETIYNVDLTIGMCTCPEGSTGNNCKHQIASSHYVNSRLPQNFCNCPSQRRYLAIVAVGEEKVTTDQFFKELNKSEFTCDCKFTLLKDDAADTELLIAAENSAHSEVEIRSSQQNTSEEASLLERDSSVKLFKNALELLDSSKVRKVLQIFRSKLIQIKSQSQLTSFLHTAGSAVFKKRFNRKKLCQPKSVARRTAVISRGKCDLLKKSRQSKIKKTFC